MKEKFLIKRFTKLTVLDIKNSKPFGNFRAAKKGRLFYV